MTGRLLEQLSNTGNPLALGCLHSGAFFHHPANGAASEQAAIRERQAVGFDPIVDQDDRLPISLEPVGGGMAIRVGWVFHVAKLP